jgi:hypothetical protein
MYFLLCIVQFSDFFLKNLNYRTEIILVKLVGGKRVSVEEIKVSKTRKN